MAQAEGKTGDVYIGAAAGSRAWMVGQAMLAEGSCAHWVVFKCSPQWIQALATQMPDILIQGRLRVAVGTERIYYFITFWI